MDRELEHILHQDFPLFFKDMWGDKRETCMGWGITCGNGWYEIIREIASEITKLNETLPPEEKVYAAQVKEKFGRLVVYVSAGDQRFKRVNDRAYQIIERLERKSSITCEICGGLNGELTSSQKYNKEGEIVPGGWVRTLCPPHRTKDRRVISINEHGARFI